MAPLRYAAQFAIWQHCSYLVPAAEPHGEDGAVLDDDGERRREDDLGRDEEEARPRVAPHLVLLQVAVPVAEQTRGAQEP